MTYIVGKMYIYMCSVEYYCVYGLPDSFNPSVDDELLQLLLSELISMLAVPLLASTDNVLVGE